jgi:MmyB-like transcription regulator ligand binding domain
LDKGVTDLVGELSGRSRDFRTRWAAHDVRRSRSGFDRLHHRVVGDLDLTYEALEFTSDPGLTLLVHAAEPGSPTEEALDVLTAGAGTLDPLELPPAGPDCV